MTRIELGGKGDPIPDVALPDPATIGELPSTIVEFKDGDVFDKEWWMNYGFTHYEVWCVGAAGGRGGSIGKVKWLELWNKPSMPPDIWEMYKEQQVLIWESGTQYQNYDGTWWHESGSLIETPNWTPGQPATDYWVHWADYLYPARDPITAVTHQNPFLEEVTENYAPYGQLPGPYLPFGLGGGGGGGGTHVVNGELATLPDFCPIVVGQAGADAGPGQTRVNGPWVSQKSDFLTFLQEPNWDQGYAGWSGYARRLNQLDRLIAVWSEIYPDPMPTFLPPQPGEDGGASSFGGDICKASGGKGGQPAMIWVGGSKQIHGFGGEGGVGGRLESGGGAPGSTDFNPGKDGTWINGVGKGGGGGRGGSEKTDITVTRDATNGGKGTLSYADTSVHGKGETWSYWIRIDRRYRYDLGTIEYETPVMTTSKYVPGGGGGVRILRKFPYGSRAAGYNPNGHVVIRLAKIT